MIDRSVFLKIQKTRNAEDFSDIKNELVKKTTIKEKSLIQAVSLYHSAIKYIEPAVSAYFGNSSQKGSINIVFNQEAIELISKSTSSTFKKELLSGKIKRSYLKDNHPNFICANNASIYYQTANNLIDKIEKGILYFALMSNFHVRSYVLDEISSLDIFSRRYQLGAHLRYARLCVDRDGSVIILSDSDCRLLVDSFLKKSEAMMIGNGESLDRASFMHSAPIVNSISKIVNSISKRDLAYIEALNIVSEFKMIEVNLPEYGVNRIEKRRVPKKELHEGAIDNYIIMSKAILKPEGYNLNSEEFCSELFDFINKKNSEHKSFIDGLSVEAKKIITKNNDYCVVEVKGNAIRYYYNSVSYEGSTEGINIEYLVSSAPPRNSNSYPDLAKSMSVLKYIGDGNKTSGPLWGSCMRYPKNSREISFYASNTDLCSMLIYLNKGTNKIAGRAIVWTDVDTNKKYIDRVYFSKEEARIAILNKAEKDGYTCIYGGQIANHSQNFKIRFKGSDEAHYIPYFDSISNYPMESRGNFYLVSKRISSSEMITNIRVGEITKDNISELLKVKCVICGSRKESALCRKHIIEHGKNAVLIHDKKIFGITNLVFANLLNKAKSNGDIKDAIRNSNTLPASENEKNDINGLIQLSEGNQEICITKYNKSDATKIHGLSSIFSKSSIELLDADRIVRSSNDFLKGSVLHNYMMPTYAPSRYTKKSDLIDFNNSESYFISKIRAIAQKNMYLSECVLKYQPKEIDSGFMPIIISLLEISARYGGRPSESRNRRNSFFSSAGLATYKNELKKNSEECNLNENDLNLLANFILQKNHGFSDRYNSCKITLSEDGLLSFDRNEVVRYVGRTTPPINDESAIKKWSESASQSIFGDPISLSKKEASSSEEDDIVTLTQKEMRFLTIRIGELLAGQFDISNNNIVRDIINISQLNYEED